MLLFDYRLYEFRGPCCCRCITSVVSDSVRPHRWQPIRLPHPWDSPGKNTGMGCHVLLQCVKVKSLSHVRLSATPWTAAYQAPLSMGFSRQEYWSGVPLPSPSGLLGDPYLLSFNHFETLVKWINIVSQWPMILLCFKIFLIFLTNFPKYQNLTKAFSASSWLWDTSKEHLWDISKRKVKLSLLDMLITSKSLSNGWRRTLGYRKWINASNVDFPKFMWNH